MQFEKKLISGRKCECVWLSHVEPVHRHQCRVDRDGIGGILRHRSEWIKPERLRRHTTYNRKGSINRRTDVERATNAPRVQISVAKTQDGGTGLHADGST